jgi:enamine deaminase RidA (YjgF/YER057c/UK114 family)
MENRIQQKLESLNIHIPTPAKPLGSYVPAIYIPGDTNHKKGQVWTSGQLPLMDGKLLHSGSLGKDISIEQGAEAAARCFVNALATLHTVGFSVENVSRVLKLTGYVQSDKAFYEQPAVVNGASDLAHQIFEEAGVHARSAIGVSHLPMNSCIELEVVFEVTCS